MRYLNDITASLADFVVSEKDYAGTLRQVMFDSLNQLAGRLPPEVALRIMTLAMDYSDLPNNAQIADELRKLTGERDPNKEPTPEEQQQMQQQQQMQAQALQLQQEQARQALAEQVARVREINARADKLQAEAQALGAEPDADDQQRAQAMEGAAATARRDADLELDKLRQQLAKAQADLANKTLQLSKESDVRLQVARIDADSRERVAQIQAASRHRLDGIDQTLAQAAEGAQPVPSLPASAPPN